MNSGLVATQPHCLILGSVGPGPSVISPWPGATGPVVPSACFDLYNKLETHPYQPFVV